jgi:hypothetical protein
VKYYAAQTSTRSTLAKLREIGVGLLYSTAPKAPIKIREGFSWCLDNGAWSAHTKGEPWDEASFVRGVELAGQGADWIMVPDVVGDCAATLELARTWIPRLKGIAPLYLAIQDGANGLDLPVGDIDGIALGGSTDYKLRTMEIWGAWARARGLKYHVLRVNTPRRIAQAIDAGADSADGSGIVQFPAAHNFRLLRCALSQPALYPPRGELEIAGDMLEDAFRSGQVDRIAISLPL